MFLPKNQIEILEAIAENEKLVSDLYRLYSEKFSDYKDFWLHLVNEEIGHMSSIKTLTSRITKGDFYFDENRFKKEAIENFSIYLKEKIEKVNKEGLGLIEALVSGLNIENALIEKEYFKIFESDSPATKYVFSKLESETENHRKILKEFLEKVRQENNI